MADINKSYQRLEELGLKDSTESWRRRQTAADDQPHRAVADKEHKAADATILAYCNIGKKSDGQKEQLEM